MSKMVEQVARVLRAKQSIVGPDYEALARAAIEAMREPDEAVREKIAEIVWNSMIDRAEPPSLDDARNAADTIVAAMIDEALK